MSGWRLEESLSFPPGSCAQAGEFGTGCSIDRHLLQFLKISLLSQQLSLNQGMRKNMLFVHDETLRTVARTIWDLHEVVDRLVGAARSPGSFLRVTALPGPQRVSQRCSGVLCVGLFVNPGTNVFRGAKWLTLVQHGLNLVIGHFVAFEVLPDPVRNLDQAIRVAPSRLLVKADVVRQQPLSRESGE